MRIHSFLIEFNSRNLHIGEKGDREFFISAKTISRNKNTETPLHILTFFFFSNSYFLYGRERDNLHFLLGK